MTTFTIYDITGTIYLSQKKKKINISEEYNKIQSAQHNIHYVQVSKTLEV